MKIWWELKILSSDKLHLFQVLKIMFFKEHGEDIENDAEANLSQQWRGWLFEFTSSQLIHSKPSGTLIHKASAETMRRDTRK